MIINETPIKDLFEITPQKFDDERGLFFELYHKERYQHFIGNNADFVQDNVSRSKKNTLRGIHLQLDNPQGKLVSVLHGSIYDVAIDLRKESETYKKWYAVILSEENLKQFWIPEGFGHAFLSLEDNTIVNYKCTNFYDPSSEVTLLWNDSDLRIDWPCDLPHLSKKDREGISLKDFILNEK